MDRRARLTELVRTLSDNQLEPAILILESLRNSRALCLPSEDAGLTAQLAEHNLDHDGDDASDGHLQIRQVGKKRWSKNWGGGVEAVEATVFEVARHNVTLKLRVGAVEGGRAAYGADRVRYHVALGSKVLVEFTGADDFDESGRVFTILKRADRTQVMEGGVVPEAYRGFNIAPVADLVYDGKRHRSLAIVLHHDDIEAMAKCGFLRWRDLYEK